MTKLVKAINVYCEELKWAVPLELSFRKTEYVIFAALSGVSRAIGWLFPFPDIGLRPYKLFAILGRYRSVCAKRSAQKLLDYYTLAIYLSLICHDVLPSYCNITPVRRSGSPPGIDRLMQRYIGLRGLYIIQGIPEGKLKVKQNL